MKNIVKILNRYLYEIAVNIKHHNIYLKIFIFLFLLSWVFYLSAYKFLKKPLDLKVGDIAPYDIKINDDIEYVDAVETEAKRSEIISNIPPTFQFNLKVPEKAKERVDKYFDKIEEIDKKYSNMDDKCEQAILTGNVKDKTLLKTLFQNYKLYNFRLIAKVILDKIYMGGVSDTPYENTKALSRSGYLLKIYTNPQGEEISIKTGFEDLYYPETMNYPEIIKKAYVNLAWEKVRFFDAYLREYIEPNVFYDKILTDEKIMNAIDLVKPVKTRLKKGQIIIREGQELNESNFKLLKEMVKYSSETTIMRGYFIILFIIFALSFILFKIYAKLVYDNLKSFLFLASFVFMAAALIYLCPLINNFMGGKIVNGFFIPIGGFAILLYLLIGFRVAFFVVFFLSILSAFLIGFDFMDFIVILSAGIFSLSLAKFLKRRVYIWYLGLAISIFYFILNLGIADLQNYSRAQSMNAILIGTINGFASIIISMGLYPLFENIFNLLTEYKLLELSDLNLPIMKKLLIEAPGTYNHSILIANLAETASLEINANSLLARVGGYYHDIGKLENPEYYIENQAGADDKHNKIKPSISRSVVKSHIKYGDGLARKLNLPEEVINIIIEHHGTTIISFFYNKALQAKYNEDNSTKEDLNASYRYEGPKPSTKEAAIVMLADAVEATCRSLRKPSYSRLEEIVHKIINERFLDGQLSNCPLTLIDLNKIAGSFSHMLAAMYHTRIEYPENNPSGPEVKKPE